MRFLTILLTTLIISLPFSSLTQAGTLLGGQFSLIDQSSHRFDSTELQGKIVLLFFGYTHCPDICPTGLAHINTVLSKINIPDKVAGVFITVDPERDDTARLKEYLAYFDQGIIGLTGSTSQIEQVSQQFGSKLQVGGYQKVDHAAMGHTSDKMPMNMAMAELVPQNEIEHSSNLYIIDEYGKLALAIPYGMPTQHTLDIVNKMLDKSM